jgi:hypothetical protein
VTKFEKVKPNDVKLDASFQREPNVKRVDEMAAAFDPNMVGVPVLSRRADGTMVALDGQHRIAAAKKAGHGEYPLLMEIHHGLSAEEEARLFLKLNEMRLPVPLFDRFKARLVEKDLIATEIEAQLERAGVKLAKSPAKRTVCAIQAVSRAYQRGNLEPTLRVLTEWMDGAAAAYDGELVKAVSAFLKEYPKVNIVEVATRLRAHLPSNVAVRLRQAKHDRECSADEAACIVLREIFNERRKAINRLPPYKG